MDFKKISSKIDSLFKELDENLVKETKKLEETEKEEYIYFNQAYDITKKKMDEIYKNKKDIEDFKEIISFIFTEYFFQKAKELEEKYYSDNNPKYLN